MTEVWKPIPDFDGYEVSDQGNVRSYRQRGGGEFYKTPHLLKPSKTGAMGRLGVNLRRNGLSYYIRNANLVMLAFVGPCPDGYEICHNNSIPADNRLENLRYDTHGNNMQDMSDRCKESKTMSKYSEVITGIRQSLGLTMTKFSELAGVSLPLVSRWEGGSRTPGMDKFVVLFNLASPEQKWELVNAITDGDDTSTVVFPPSGPVRAVAAKRTTRKETRPT